MAVPGGAATPRLFGEAAGGMALALIALCVNKHIDCSRAGTGAHHCLRLDSRRPRPAVATASKVT